MGKHGQNAVVMKLVFSTCQLLICVLIYFRICEDNLCPFLPDSTCLGKKFTQVVYGVSLNFFLQLFSGVPVEWRFSSKGSEDPATHFWWRFIHNWITHPVRRLSV